MIPLYHRLQAQAARAPDALAIQTADQPLSYRQFIALADATAQQFQAQGLGTGDLIGWLGHNSAQMLAALLACAKLDAVFVPLNWRLAPDELVAIARHAGLSALHHTPELAALAARVLAAAPCTGPDQPMMPGDVLMVYTSGTTGSPKGAVHTQRGMLANIDIALAVQCLTAADRVLAVLPLFHVGGLCIQVLPALVVGAAVKLQARFEPGAWLQDVATWRPSAGVLVPALMRALVSHPGWAAADLASLRFVNAGSSIVPLDLIDAFHRRGVSVAQVYGSTETGPVSIALRPDQALAHAGQVGQPAPGVAVRLVDADQQPVPPGQVGEIQLQAPNLMRAYHRQPAEAGFSAGWLTTGDLAFADAQGFVTVVGRCQDMIISGGENIYPAEIENLASAWPGVAEAAVVGLPDPRWGEVPVLVLLAQVDAVIDLPGLRALFDAQLARYKHPRRIDLVETLPRTALGKVQKQRLVDQLQT